MVWSGEKFSKRKLSDGWIRPFQIIFHKYSISQESNVTNLLQRISRKCARYSLLSRVYHGPGENFQSECSQKLQNEEQ